MCPVLFKGSRSLLLLACCYVPIVRRMLIFKGGTWSSGNRTVIVVRVRHCLSVLVYAGLSMFTCCRALLVAGCTRLPMRITLQRFATFAKTATNLHAVAHKVCKNG